MLQHPRSVVVALLVALLAGCSSPTKRRSPAPARAEPIVTTGGPIASSVGAAYGAPEAGIPPVDARPSPAEIERLPEPEPRIEPIRPSGPNKPYVVGGETIVPETRDEPQRDRGTASWYGGKFHGRRTANGEVFNMYAFSAAHRTWPIPSYARVRHVASGRELVVRVNDRGPFSRGRMLDLSYAAAVKLGFVAKGQAEVEIERLTHEQIRTGSWRNRADAPALVAAPATAVPAEGRSAADDRPLSDALVPVSTAALEAPVASSEVRAASEAARGFWLQLGAFRDLGGAGSFQQRVQSELDWLAPMLAIFLERPLYRLQAGPFATRDQAQRAAQRLRESLQLVPMLVQRR